MIRNRLMSPALAGFGSLLSVAVGIGIDGHGQANAVWTDDASQSPNASLRTPLSASLCGDSITLEK